MNRKYDDSSPRSDDMKNTGALSKSVDVCLVGIHQRRIDTVLANVGYASSMSHLYAIFSNVLVEVRICP